MPWKSQIDFCACGKWSVRKPPPFCLEKKPLKPHWLSGGADVEQVDHQQVAGLDAAHAYRPRKEMDDGQVDVAHVVGRLVVLDEAAGPVIGFRTKSSPGLTQQAIGISGCQRLWTFSFS